MQYMTLATARDTVSKFFAGRDNATEVPIEDIFAIMGRDPSDPEKNKSWLTNKLTHLKHYNLVEPVYSDGRPRRLVAVRMTHQGQQELGRGSTLTVSNGGVVVGGNSADRTVSLNSIAQDIKRYEQQNPDIELDLSVRIRKEAPATP